VNLQNRRPRIADVAREAGVSKSAVSFAFNNPDRLAPETALRIREIADRLGYRPDPVARMLTQRQTMTLGILTPQALSVVFSNPFFGAFSEGVSLAAEQFDYGLHFISPIHGSLLGAVNRATVDGVIAVGVPDRHPEVEQIRRAGVPIVFVDSSAFPEHASIEADDTGGARQAAEHLIALGHREVLVLGVEPPLPGQGGVADVTARRLLGYQQAFAAIDAAIPDAHVFVGAATIAGGNTMVEQAWHRGLRPTAILAMSDAAAIGAMRALRELQLDVPRDVSVIGFDDIDLAPIVHPPLTTVHQPIRRKGEEAVHLLLSVIEGQGTAKPEHRVLRTRLIIRDSTGPVSTRHKEVAGN
jgi:DNA-binding LacI/PurR family transcriptional regulator